MANRLQSPPAAPERNRPAGPKQSPSVVSVVASPAPAARAGFDWGRLVVSRWLIGVIAITFLLEGAMIYWFRIRTPPETVALAGEIPLGTFEFNRSSPRENRLYHGRFDLFVRRSDPLEPAQQRQLAHDQQHLQQAVEETLRRMRFVDFTDPRLTRLKNRMLERLNDELGFDGIAEVLIENFKIEAAAQTAPSPISRPAEPPGTEAGS